jgi:hypothetical protein
MESMNMLSAKILIPVTLAITLISLIIFFRKSVQSEILIKATPEKIWNALMDKENYHKWNPILNPQSGNYTEGETIKYKMTIGDNTSDVDAKVIEVIENKKLNQRGGMPGIMTFNHTWTLEKTEGGTKVTQHEEYKGVGVLFWNPKEVGKAYEQVNTQLKSYIENNQ